MADEPNETSVPLSDAEIEMVRDTYADATRKPQEDWLIEDLGAVAACAVLYIPRLLATLAAFDGPEVI